MKKIILIICSFAFFLGVFSQEEETDLTFVKPKQKQEKETKKVSFLLQANTGLSFLSGGDFKRYKEDLEAYKAFENIEVYDIKPLPTLHVAFQPQINFTSKIGLGVGASYRYMGWREKVIDEDSPLTFTTNVNFLIHYIGPSIYLRYKPLKFMGFRFGNEILLKIEDKAIINAAVTDGIRTETRNIKTNIKDAINITPSPFTFLGNISVDFYLYQGLILTTGANYNATSNFDEVNFSFVGAELGLAYEF